MRYIWKTERNICIRKEKREESDTHVMDTRWRTERNRYIGKTEKKMYQEGEEGGN
jgi:hypothetical protein